MVQFLNFQLLDMEMFLIVEDQYNVKYREKVAEKIGRVRDVKISPDGFIYLAVDNKGIFKIVP